MEKELSKLKFGILTDSFHTFGLWKVPEHMAHFVALEENKDPLPSGDDPRPDDEAEEDETRSVLAPVLRPPDPAEAKPDSLCS